VARGRKKNSSKYQRLNKDVKKASRSTDPFKRSGMKKSKSDKRSQAKKKAHPHLSETQEKVSKVRSQLKKEFLTELGFVAPKKSKGRKASASLTQLPEAFIFNGKPNYTPQSIKQAFNGDIKAMREEYSRLRAVAQKRLQRLAKSRYSGSEVYKYYNDTFKKLKSISDKGLPEALTSINRFLSNPLSTLRGQTELRNTRIETLQSYGYNVNESNFDKVIEVMEEVRSMIQSKLYDSDQVLQEVVEIVNGIINDPDNNLNNKSSKEIANEVYDQYASSSSDLLSLSIK